VTHLTSVRAQVQFSANRILNPNNEVLGIAKASGGLYRLPCVITGLESAYISRCIGDKDVEAALVARTTTATASLDVWHARHIST
jgi:hypothetical protein